MPRFFLLALLALLGACTASAGSSVDLERYRVTRPGAVLFERDARALVLESLPQAYRARWCGADGGSWQSHEPIMRIRVPNDEDEEHTDVRAEPFTWTIMTASAAAFGLDDDTARAALVDNLRRWAEAEALTELERHENAYYSLERALLPIIVAYSLVRPDLNAQDRKLIEQWLNRLVRLRGVKRPDGSRGDVSRRNNHRYLSDSVDMAWGAYRGNDALFRKGIESYFLALGQMREDGSLPLETARGARALWYQRHAIASLVAIAEMAAVQGYDLYGTTVDGRSLDDAIALLADAIDDPERIWPYAEEDVRPGTSRSYRDQDLTFMARRGHGRHYMAWLETYRARFPWRAAARRLWAQVQAFDPEPRPMIDEYSGGNTTCFFALPAPEREAANSSGR